MYLVVKPTLLITEPDGTKASKDVSQPIVMQKLGYQHNAEFNQVMLRWRKTLFTARTAFEFPPSGASFRFVVRKSPAFVTIRSQFGRRITVPPEIAARCTPRRLRVAGAQAPVLDATRSAHRR